MIAAFSSRVHLRRPPAPANTSNRRTPLEPASTRLQASPTGLGDSPFSPPRSTEGRSSAYVGSPLLTIKVRRLIVANVSAIRRGGRGVAQAGSAPGLGPGGRRFESCLPDHRAPSNRLHATRSALLADRTHDVTIVVATRWWTGARSPNYATASPLCLSLDERGPVGRSDQDADMGQLTLVSTTDAGRLEKLENDG